MNMKHGSISFVRFGYFRTILLFQIIFNYKWLVAKMQGANWDLRDVLQWSDGLFESWLPASKLYHMLKIH